VKHEVRTVVVITRVTFGLASKRCVQAPI